MYEASNQSISPAQAQVIRDFVLPVIESGHRINRLLIQELPSDKLGFQPDPKSPPLSEVFWNLLTIEHMFLSAIGTGQISSLPEKPESITVETLLEWTDAHFPADFERLASLSGEDLVRPVECMGLSARAIELLNSCVGNTSQQRGQVSVYLRMCCSLESSASTAAGELTDADLANVSGGVTVTAHYLTQTAQQLGWFGPPQGFSDLGSLFGNSNKAGFGAIAGAPGLSILAGLSEFLLFLW